MKQRELICWLVLTTSLVVLYGCSSTTEPLAVDDLIGDFGVLMTDSVSSETLSGQGARLDGSAMPAPNAAPSTEPTAGEIEIPFPGTGSVMQWPIVQELPITAQRKGSGEIALSWPGLSEDLWPNLDAGPEPDPHLGNAWMIYWTGSKWVAETVEWLREGERGGTVFDPDDKLTAGSPSGNDPVGFFVAGPSRHSADLPEYRRRTKPSWSTWSDLSPFAFEEPEAPETPVPAPEPTNEVHVWISGLTTELQGGTLLTFDGDVGDIELLSLRDQTIELVSTEVPAGTFLYVDFSIDPNRSFVIEDGVQKELRVPSEPVRVSGPFAVEAGGPTTVTLDFRADESLIKNDDGTWSLNPVVALVINANP